VVSRFLGSTANTLAEVPFWVLTREAPRCHVLDWGLDPTMSSGTFWEDVPAVEYVMLFASGQNIHCE